MRINQAVKSTPIFTHEGAKAVHITPLQELVRTVMTCMLWEDSFYENGQSVADRIKALVHSVPLEAAAGVAIEARNNMKLRHAPLLVVREMARHPKLAANPKIVSETLAAVIQRADELSEFLAIYWKDGKQPLSKQVKLGLAKAFQKFNEFQFARYNRDHEVKLRDVLFLSHAKPADLPEFADQWTRLSRKEYNPEIGFTRGFTEGELLYGRLVNGELQTPDTWEVALSAGADKKETFERLMAEKQLGALAFLRNLRNMIQANVSMLAITTYAQGLNVDRVLPFRFLSAARVVPQLEPVLEPLMLKCLEGQTKLKGKTTLLIDVSGSMNDRVSSKSDLTRLDAAKALAILLREVCETVDVLIFNTQVGRVPPRRGFSLADAVGHPSGGTDTGLAVAVANQEGYDRLIVITDEQSRTAVQDPVGLAYMINVASNKNGVGYGKWLHIDGWSEAVVDYILAYENKS